MITIRATFSDEDFPTGFYPSDIWPQDFPDNAVIISTDQWAEFLRNPGTRKFIDGEVVEYTPPALLPTVDDYRKSVQSLLDARVTERQYDNGATLASYVNSTNEQWAAEARAFVVWRDQVWAYALAELDKAQSGEREQPSVEVLLNELPVFEWPRQGKSE